MSYLPHEQRVVDELQELTTKMAAIHALIPAVIFGNLDPIDRILLLKQYTHMSKYAKVLQKRVDRFVQQPKDREAETFTAAEQAIRVELYELDNKISALGRTTPTAVFIKLPANERSLLLHQIRYMHDYARILRERIALFTH